MSTDEAENEDDMREEQIDILVDNSRDILSISEDIAWVFGDSFGSDRLHNNYDDYVNTMQLALRDEVREGDEMELTLALANVVSNLDIELYENLKDRDEELSQFIRELSMEYSLDMERRLNRIRQGHNYWNNVKSDLAVRSSRPAFTHELLIDYSDRVEFDSNLNATAILSRHFLTQVAKALDTLGDDLIGYMQEEEVRQIYEISEELLEKFDEFDPDEFEDPLLEEIPDNELLGEEVAEGTSDEESEEIEE